MPDATLSISAATATGAGSAVPVNGRTYGIQVTSTTTPSALVVALQGTLDAANWFSLGTAWTIASQAIGDILWFVDKPCAQIRANCTTLTAASIAAITSLLDVDSTAAQIDAGTHTWGITYVYPAGESTISTNSTYRIADGTHTSTDLTIPALVGTATSINLYRTKAAVPPSGTPTNAQWWRVAAGVTASSTYTDKIPDASLTVHPPALPNVTAYLVSV